MHHALTITEILIRIFALLPCSSNAANARVCKIWSNLALDVIWEEVHNVGGLFSSLAPTTLNEETGEVNFVRPPSLDDWAAFLVNARRVLRLNLLTGKLKLSVMALYRIAATRPLLVIFPNVQEIIASCLDTIFDPLFMNVSVKRMTLMLSVERGAHFDEENLTWKASEIVRRMPQIESLAIGSNLGRASPIICQLIQGLPNLVDLKLPSRVFVSSVIEAASRLSKLRAVDIHNVPKSFYKPRTTLSPNIAPGAFPSLTSICLTSTLPDATQLVENSSFPSCNILHFRLFVALHPQHVLPAHHLPQFTTALANNCVALEGLRILLDIDSNGDSSPNTEAVTRSPVLRFADIVPILTMSHLTALHIVNAMAIIMADDQARDLACALPRLRTLNLSRSATVAQPSGPHLSLRSLIHFAQHCPNIQSIGLHLDVTASIPPGSEAIPFSALRVLHLGYSTISLQTVKPTILFLARSLPAESKLAVLSDDLHNFLLTQRMPIEDITEQHRAWREVQDALTWIQAGKNILTENEMVLKRRVETLEKENARLTSLLHSS